MKKVLLVLAIGFGVLFFNSYTDNIEEIENSNEIQTTANNSSSAKMVSKYLVIRGVKNSLKFTVGAIIILFVIAPYLHIV